MSIQEDISSAAQDLASRQYGSIKEANNPLAGRGQQVADLVNRFRSTLMLGGVGYLAARAQSSLNDEDEGTARKRRLMYLLGGGAAGLGVDSLRNDVPNPTAYADAEGAPQFETAGKIPYDKLVSGGIQPVIDSKGEAVKPSLKEQYDAGELNKYIRQSVAGGVGGAALGAANRRTLGIGGRTLSSLRPDLVNRDMLARVAEGAADDAMLSQALRDSKIIKDANKGGKGKGKGKATPNFNMSEYKSKAKAYAQKQPSLLQRAKEVPGMYQEARTRAKSLLKPSTPAATPRPSLLETITRGKGGVGGYFKNKGYSRGNTAIPLIHKEMGKKYFRGRTLGPAGAIALPALGYGADQAFKAYYGN